MGANFENIESLEMPADLAAEFSQLDRAEFITQRNEQYTEICCELGAMLLGPKQYYEVTPPFAPTGNVLRVYSEPLTRPTLRRISVNVLKTSSANAGIPQSALDSPEFDTAILRDHVIDLDRTTLRASHAEIGRSFTGAWRMDTKKPTFLDVKTSTGEAMGKIVQVRRGEKHEQEFLSLPLLTGREEIMVLRQLLKLAPFLSATFQEEVTLQLEYSKNHVTY